MRFWRKKWLLLAAIGLIVALGILAWLFWPRLEPIKALSDTPSYATVTPRGSSVSWQRLNPPDGSPLYVYVDTIQSVSVQVSEQQLPSSFSGNVDAQVANIAKGYSATDGFTVGSTQVYIGTSAQGPQSVIFTQKGLLILIKSTKKIDDSTWKTYIASLS